MRKWIAQSKYLVGVAVFLALAIAQFVAFTGLVHAALWVQVGWVTAPWAHCPNGTCPW